MTKKNSKTKISYNENELFFDMFTDENKSKKTQKSKNHENSSQQKAFRQIFSVSEISQKIKELLDKNFQEIWVEGEISNGKLQSSGHFYFTLKDGGAQIKAVMFNNLYKLLKFAPKDGTKVLLKGDVSSFVKAGIYQLVAFYMEPKGIGALQLAFEQLKEKLLKEGLFDRTHKKQLPILPQKIGIITSPTGAAIRDILAVLNRRYSNINAIIFPVRVQGETAKFEICEALKYFNENLRDVDVILLGRGGGSIEDLWAFNEELVARSIFESEIPIISCVGHEVDFTIADFVSDLRAPAPSAAAELVISDKRELKAKIDFFKHKIFSEVKFLVEAKIADFEFLKISKFLQNPLLFIDEKIQVLDFFRENIERIYAKILDKKAYKLGLIEGKLANLSPKKIISRGYAVLFDENKKILNTQNLKKNDKIQILTENLEILCQVLRLGKNKIYE